MSSQLQGRALAVLDRVARAYWPDRLRLRKPLEKLLLNCSHLGFRLAAERAGRLPRSSSPADLFDLSLSDEQRMLVEMLEAFSLEHLRPLGAVAVSR
ncbi:hypothetical protein HBN74_12930 [Pseudomonas sp. WS 5019]|nr:hypothetical protein [Pseudomonas sp. WS 5019]NMY16454.1 hypothetical protein [Pseudomonas sp. WS 5019]